MNALSDWFRANAGAINAIATLVLVGITGWYAWMNHNLSKALRDAIVSQRRAEVLGLRQTRLELLSIAGRLQTDLLAVLQHQSVETISKMNREPWRADRENLQLIGAAVGGVVGEYAGTAAEALRVWEQLMNQRARATEPDAARQFWKEAIDRLWIARWAVEHLIEQAAVLDDDPASGATPVTAQSTSEKAGEDL